MVRMICGFGKKKNLYLFFSEKSAYNFIISKIGVGFSNSFVNGDLYKIWKCIPTPKVLGLSRKLLVGKLPTKFALVIRGVFFDGGVGSLNLSFMF